MEIGGNWIYLKSNIHKIINIPLIEQIGPKVCQPNNPIALIFNPHHEAVYELQGPAHGGLGQSQVRQSLGVEG